LGFSICCWKELPFFCDSFDITGNELLDELFGRCPNDSSM
jgi:hypothetical protein